MVLPPATLATADAIVLVVCAVFALRGAWKGFAWQAVRTIGLVAAVAGAGLLHQRFGGWLGAHVPVLPEAATPWVAWVLLLAGILFVATWFAWMARGALRAVQLGGLDRLLGLVLGAGMGLVIVTLGFLVWGSFASDEELHRLAEGSVAFPWMARVVDVGRDLMPDDVERRWREVLDTLHDATGS